MDKEEKPTIPQTVRFVTDIHKAITSLATKHGVTFGTMLNSLLIECRAIQHELGHDRTLELSKMIARRHLRILEGAVKWPNYE